MWWGRECERTADKKRKERERTCAQGPQPVDHYVKCRWAAPAAAGEAQPAATATAGEKEEGQCNVQLVLQDMPCICHCGMHFNKCLAARLNYMTQIAIATTTEEATTTATCHRRRTAPPSPRCCLPHLTLCAPVEINICTQNAILQAFPFVVCVAMSVYLCMCVYSMCVCFVHFPCCPFSLPLSFCIFHLAA